MAHSGTVHCHCLQKKMRTTKWLKMGNYPFLNPGREALNQNSPQVSADVACMQLFNVCDLCKTSYHCIYILNWNFNGCSQITIFRLINYSLLKGFQSWGWFLFCLENQLKKCQKLKYTFFNVNRLSCSRHVTQTQTQAEDSKDVWYWSVGRGNTSRDHCLQQNSDILYVYSPLQHILYWEESNLYQW